MSRRILAIDDEKSVRDAFLFALTPSEYVVETAASGEEGIGLACANRPDLVFLDLRMPGIDGVETLRRLRQCMVDAPVFIVTAFRKDFMPALETGQVGGGAGLRDHGQTHPGGADPGYRTGGLRGLGEGATRRGGAS